MLSIIYRDQVAILTGLEDEAAAYQFTAKCIYIVV